MKESASNIRAINPKGVKELLDAKDNIQSMTFCIGGKHIAGQEKFKRNQTIY